MDPDDFKTAALTDVNAHIAEMAAETPSDETAWLFFCECGDPDCQQQVELSFESYVGVRIDRRPILARGHRVNPSTRAKRLVEESQALRAQAELQLKRAKKNVP